MINTTAYSFAAQAYGEEEIEKIVSLFEGFVGVGLSIGPLLGSVAYHLVGFQATFIMFGVAMIPPAVLIMCFLPTPQKARGDLDESREADAAIEVLDEQGLKLISP